MRKLSASILLFILVPLTVHAIFMPEEFRSNNVKLTFGAAGNGTTDDTQALRRALSNNRTHADSNDYYFPRPTGIYLPAGTYLVSDTLAWIGCCMTIQGAGRGVTVIRLKNSSSRFGNPATPRAMLNTKAGNHSFRQNIHDLTIHTGSGNPGAIGLSWISSNNGCLSNVEIVSGDGAGVYGIDMRREWPGPALIKNVAITGFDYGVMMDNREYGITFENLVLTNQKKAGLFNGGNMVHIIGLRSTNSVPAIVTENEWTNQKWSVTTVIDAQMTGGASSTSAIVNNDLLYARDVHAQGYRSAISAGNTAVPGNDVTEYVSEPVRTLFTGTPAASLNLPIVRPPDQWETTASKWGKMPYVAGNEYYIDGNRLDSLLTSGVTTIYTRLSGVTLIDREFEVPATVKHITGFNCGVNDDRDIGLTFVVKQASTTPLVIERFGYGVTVKHQCSRPVVIRHGNMAYVASAGAGDVFIEDLTTDAVLEFVRGQRVWAYQLNTEVVAPNKIINDGADLWILGIKTENRGTVIDTRNRGRTELLGGLLYPLAGFTPQEDTVPMFRCVESSFTAVCGWSAYGNNSMYKILVSETRNATTRPLMTSAVDGHAMALFAAHHPQLPVRTAGSRRVPGHESRLRIVIPFDHRQVERAVRDGGRLFRVDGRNITAQELTGGGRTPVGLIVQQRL